MWSLRKNWKPTDREPIIVTDNFVLNAKLRLSDIYSQENSFVRLQCAPSSLGDTQDCVVLTSDFYGILQWSDLRFEVLGLRIAVEVEAGMRFRGAIVDVIQVGNKSIEFTTFPTSCRIEGKAGSRWTKGYGRGYDEPPVTVFCLNCEKIVVVHQSTALLDGWWFHGTVDGPVSELLNHGDVVGTCPECEEERKALRVKAVFRDNDRPGDIPF
jgi:hypothetical protein